MNSVLVFDFTIVTPFCDHQGFLKAPENNYLKCLHFVILTASVHRTAFSPSVPLHSVCLYVSPFPFVSLSSLSVCAYRQSLQFIFGMSPPLVKFGPRAEVSVMG